MEGARVVTPRRTRHGTPLPRSRHLGYGLVRLLCRALQNFRCDLSSTSRERRLRRRGRSRRRQDPEPPRSVQTGRMPRRSCRASLPRSRPSRPLAGRATQCLTPHAGAPRTHPRAISSPAVITDKQRDDDAAVYILLPWAAASGRARHTRSAGRRRSRLSQVDHHQTGDGMRGGRAPRGEAGKSVGSGSESPRCGLFSGTALEDRPPRKKGLEGGIEVARRVDLVERGELKEARRCEMEKRAFRGRAGGGAKKVWRRAWGSRDGFGCGGLSDKTVCLSAVMWCSSAALKASASSSARAALRRSSALSRMRPCCSCSLAARSVLRDFRVASSRLARAARSAISAAACVRVGARVRWQDSRRWPPSPTRLRASVDARQRQSRTGDLGGGSVGAVLRS